MRRRSKGCSFKPMPAFRLPLGLADPDIEIDADAKVSIAEDGSGAWVRAWLWVDRHQFERKSP